MAPLPKNPMDMDEHFIHPGHPLKAFDNKGEYLCDGCKTLGSGKRFRCQHGCDFDLHEYCRTCPLTLSSSMHKHDLSLVMRKAQSQRQVDRICDVCADPVEGLFYRCRDCEFDVHPLCTQLPEKLHHALHKIHALTLESSSVSGFCAVCNAECNRWRYRCRVCKFDIHLECVLVPIVSCPQTPETPYQKTSETKQRKTSETNQRSMPMFDQGIPYQPPPQFASYYGHAFPYYNPAGYHFGPPAGYNMHYGQHNMNMPQNYQVGVGSSSSNNGTGGSKLGKSMFSLVGQLGFGVLSNMIFGVDLTSLFTG